jgi:glycosyltransferase involved in cell wall biosynthesis
MKPIAKSKIIVITSTFPRWKNDTDPPFVYELSKRLTADFDVIIHTPHYYGALARETMDGMQVHRFRYFISYFERLAGGQGIVPKLRRKKLYYLLLPFFLSAQFISLILLVITVKPDLIHAHWLIPQGFFAILVKKICGVPVVVTGHGADILSLQQSVFTVLKKFTVNSADRVVTVSKALAKILVADTQTTVAPDVISMGVDAAIFSPRFRTNTIRERYGMHGPYLLFVGRLTEKKGLQYLIDSMTVVLSQIPEVKLLVVGHGELEEALKRKVVELGLQDAVSFVGGLSNKDLPEYYASADIFVGPSIRTADGDSEGFGLTFVEAAMSGCLLIGTKTGGIEEIISDGQTGFLVSPEDSPALAEKILFVINNNRDLDDMRTKSREEAVKKYEWEKISTMYSSLFHKITCKKRINTVNH